VDLPVSARGGDIRSVQRAVLSKRLLAVARAHSEGCKDVEVGAVARHSSSLAPLLGRRV